MNKIVSVITANTGEVLELETEEIEDRFKFYKNKDEFFSFLKTRKNKKVYFFEFIDQDIIIYSTVMNKVVSKVQELESDFRTTLLKYEHRGEPI